MSRAEPPPRYSMMIHSLVPCWEQEGGREREGEGGRGVGHVVKVSSYDYIVTTFGGGSC